MKQNMVIAALARQVGVLLNIGLINMGLALMGTAPSLASDRAGISLLGYSGDNRYFAFEEFGIEDGSGFAYSTIYVIDIKTDRWVRGTPLRKVLEADNASLADARESTKDAAATLLARYNISTPVDILALHGDGATNVDYTVLSAGWPSYEFSAPQNSFTVTLDVFPAQDRPECSSQGQGPVRGFALTVTQGETYWEPHRDARIPMSRGCAFSYRLYGIVAPFGSLPPFNPDPMNSAIALISVYRLGFEGLDRRFIAVPLGK